MQASFVSAGALCGRKSPVVHQRVYDTGAGSIPLNRNQQPIVGRTPPTARRQRTIDLSKTNLDQIPPPSGIHELEHVPVPASSGRPK